MSENVNLSFRSRRFVYSSFLGSPVDPEVSANCVSRAACAALTDRLDYSRAV